MMADAYNTLKAEHDELNLEAIPPEIMDALARGKVDVVQAWVDSGNSVHAQTGTMGLLHLAIMSGPIRGEAAEADRARMVSWLLKQGVCFDVQNTVGGAWTPLMMASITGYPSITNMLLEAHALTGLRSQQGDSALSIAKSRKHSKIVGLLESHELLGRSVWVGGLMARVDLNGQVGAAMSYNEARGRFAVRVGSENLLMKAENLSPCGVPDDVLLAATESGYSYSRVNRWLSHAERQPRDVDAVGVLEGLGDPQGVSLLHAACHFEDNAALVNLLIRKGASVNRQSPTQGMTPLTHAIIGGHIETVEILLNARASVQARSYTGGFMLAHAAIEGDVATARLLLRHNADVNAFDHLQTPTSGRTALMYACRKGHVAAVQFFLEQGAQLETKDNDGKTALMHACFQNQPECAKMLLAAHANTDHRTKADRLSALDGARMGYPGNPVAGGHQAIIVLLGAPAVIARAQQRLLEAKAALREATTARDPLVLDGAIHEFKDIAVNSEELAMALRVGNELFAEHVQTTDWKETHRKMAEVKRRMEAGEPLDVE